MSKLSEIMETCPGCSIQLPAVDGPTVPYGGASPSCWAMFCEIMVRDYGGHGYLETHQLVVDTYMAQHPAFPSAAGRRSVAVHLVGLLCALELGLSGPEVSRTIGRVFPEKQDVEAFEPVPWLGEVNLAIVHAARDFEEHTARARVWAEAVWGA